MAQARAFHDHAGHPGGRLRPGLGSQSSHVLGVLGEVELSRALVAGGMTGLVGQVGPQAVGAGHEGKLAAVSAVGPHAPPARTARGAGSDG